MDDNRSLYTSVGGNFQILYFSVQFSYFAVEKILNTASEQAAMEATSGENYTKQTHCTNEIAHLHE